MPAERTAQQRAQDGRLAWMIVGVSALVSLTIVSLLGAWLFRQAEQSASEELLKPRSPSRSRSIDLPSTPTVPPPPNTATPIGNAGSWIGTDDYPRTALRAGEEGRVRVTLAIDAAGVPTGCSVAMSSGSWSLDNGTCSAMLRKGRFNRATPGEPGSGEGEVRRWTSPPVRWVIPD